MRRSSMTPQECHLFSAVPEHVHRFLPERSRFGVRAVVIAPREAGRIRRALMRDHGVMP